jgi:hypothetical protein
MQAVVCSTRPRESERARVDLAIYGSLNRGQGYRLEKPSVRVDLHDLSRCDTLMRVQQESRIFQELIYQLGPERTD